MGDEAFRELSMVDPKGNEFLDKVGVTITHSPQMLIQHVSDIHSAHACHPFNTFQAMAEDKSDEWFAKHNKQKTAA